MKSALYSGRVMHQRLRPARHRLAYRVFWLLLDIDELPETARRMRLFSLNRFNLFSLYERDYLAGPDADVRTRVDRQLAHAGLQVGGSIRLLTMPRILGYAFNPLSVYFCDRPEGGLQAVLYEVHNTFGERHSYLFEVGAAERDGETLAHECSKQFHVSPFLGLAMRYRFDVAPPGVARAGLSIGITASEADRPVLVARLQAKRSALSDATLALALVTHPLVTLKVIAAIHWEALLLWLKGVPLQPRPAAPMQAVTIIKTDKP